MKKMYSVLLALMLLTASVSAAATITVRADSWPPYNDEPGSDKPGYMIEVARLIFEAKGLSLDYQLMPWTRSLDSVEKGEVDAVVGTDKSESPGFVFPSEDFGIHKNGFFAKKGSAWQFAGVESLAKVKLGVIDGYPYEPALDKYIEDNKKGGKVFSATGDDALAKLLKMLKAGRVDAIIENVNVVNYSMQEGGYSGDFVNVGDLGEPSSLYMAFSPAKSTSKEYARIFDEGLADLRSSGKLQEILSRYGLKDWK